MSLAWCFSILAMAWIGFAYLGYPLGLWLLTRLGGRRDFPPLSAPPPISIVIAVHNGEHELREKLESTLSLAYPGDVEVVVTSDGSTDATEKIAESFAPQGVVLVRHPEQRGKEAAQAEAIPHASGELLVFTDVSARLEPDALTEIVKPFADPSVACVSSEDVVESGGGEGAYVRFEMALRRLESRATTLIGVSGSCFAARRHVCDPWPKDLASDFRIALESVRRGMRAVSEPRARARFGATHDTGAEWTRKVRTVRRGLAVLTAYRELLHPRFGRMAYTLWGHKVARFTSPFALLLLLGASAWGSAKDPMLLALLVGQALFYVGGCAAIGVRAASAWLPLRLAGFFLLVNASILVAWTYHLRGDRSVRWQPTKR